VEDGVTSEDRPVRGLIFIRTIFLTYDVCVDAKLTCATRIASSSGLASSSGGAWLIRKSLIVFWQIAHQFRVLLGVVMAPTELSSPCALSAMSAFKCGVSVLHGFLGPPNAELANR
jgi:hypothetical protein